MAVIFSDDSRFMLHVENKLIIYEGWCNGIGRLKTQRTDKPLLNEKWQIFFYDNAHLYSKFKIYEVVSWRNGIGYHEKYEKLPFSKCFQNAFSPVSRNNTHYQISN